MKFDDRYSDVSLSSLNIAIVGLGLMGGSLAMALRGTGATLIGVEHDTESRARALELGVVDMVADRLSDGITQADLIVFAIPVEGIVSLIKVMPKMRPEGCMILDLGSTKREIGAVMDSLPDQFAALGGHPMCGRERSGLAAATAELFEGETFILCRNARTTAEVEETVLALVAQIRARPLFVPAATHDELVAASSHLPYVVSSVLMGRAWSKAAEDGRLWQVSASGLRDTTRLAGSSPEMMLEIMLTNQEPLLAQIEAYGQELAIVADALRRKDRKALKALLETANKRRHAYLQAKYGRSGEATE